MRLNAILLLCVCLSSGGVSAADRTDRKSTAPAQDAPAHDALALLRELKPLAKVHYSWALPDHLWERPNRQLLYEIVRVTHAASLRGENCTRQVLVQAVDVCLAVNEPKPAIRASIAINYSPWHRRFGKSLPPTDRGPTAVAECALFRERLTRVRGWLDEANAAQPERVEVTAVLLDCERFQIKPGNDEWNHAITAKFDAIHDIARAVFPSARIEWYGQGVRRNASKTGWSLHGISSLGNKLDALSCSLYRIPELGYTRETFRRTLEEGYRRGVKEVTPWVALGSGYRRQVDRFERWSFDWDYDLVYSWQIGGELNNSYYGDRPARFAPWHAARVVVLYPPPMDPRVPQWLVHFVAYARGANGKRSLPPRGIR